ncbi:MAG TPA: hypothetical protein VGC66_15405 [Pyrinomonadaceae bacterium]|jgi:DNA-directed RNA polymerase specialized sigma24 family protein
MGVPPASNREKLACLTDEQWHALLNVLTYYAHRRWRGISQEDCEDLIYKTIESVYSGNRNLREGVELATAFFEIIESYYSHKWEQETIKVIVEETSSEDQEKTETKRVKRVDSLEEADLIELSSLVESGNPESQAEIKERNEKIYEMLGDDPELAVIVKLVLDEPGIKPREIAERLGIAVEDVYNATKRLARRVPKLHEEWKNKYE